MPSLSNFHADEICLQIERKTLICLFFLNTTRTNGTFSFHQKEDMKDRDIVSEGISGCWGIAAEGGANGWHLGSLVTSNIESMSRQGSAYLEGRPYMAGTDAPLSL